jgi:hypothetical protein
MVSAQQHLAMSKLSNNRVRPVVRAFAGVFGIAFALAGLLAFALLGYTVWDTVRTRHITWKLIVIAILVPIGAYSVARIILQVAVTGENPRIDADRDGEFNPQAS